KSYIWDGDSWEVITQDGLQGIQGPIGPQGPQGNQGEPGTGLVNQGLWVSGTEYNSGDYVFAESSTTPGVNSMYICQTDGYTSNTNPMDDESNWVEFQAPEGPEGPQGDVGPAGPQGNPGVSVQWLGELTTAPASPTENQAYYNTTDGKSYVYNGSTWTTMAQDGAVGPEGPVVGGTIGQMLVHDGTSWIASSNVFTDGSQNVGVGTTSPTAKLDVDGTIRIRGGSPYTGMVLTSDASGLGSWQAPYYSNWTVSGNNIYNSNSGYVGINIASTDMQSNLVVRQTANPLSGNRILLNSLAADFRQNSTSLNYASGVKFTVGNTSLYTGTAAIVAERTGSWSQGKLHFAVNDAGVSGKTDIPIAMTIDGPSGGKVGIGTLTPTEQLEVQGNIKASGALIGQSLQVGTPVEDPESPLFVVRNSNNEIVFAVYENGVRMYVASDEEKSGSKGGFAVGGLTQSKAGEEYFKVTPDSVRIYIDTTTTVTKSGSKGGFAVGGLTQSKGLPYDLMKVTGYSTRIYVGEGTAKSGSKGGFAVGGLTQSKLTPSDYLFVSPDSARIYIDEDPTKSGSKGGFAVGGLTQSKGTSEDYLRVTRDSTRIYIDDSVKKSGSKGGFAVGGLTQSKGVNSEFFNVSTNDIGVVNDEARILWYPLKNSFLAGLVNIATPADVGENSMAIGYRTMAAGNFSQALGYETQALGIYSTAIGREAVAEDNSSFAFGFEAQAKAQDSYAFGAGAIAQGIGSYAIGSIDRDTLGNTSNIPTTASGDYSFAFGLGSQANNIGAFAIGTDVISSGSGAFAMGNSLEASGSYSVAIGNNNVSQSKNSITIGGSNVASGSYSNPMGISYQTIAIGYNNEATGGGWSDNGTGQSIAIGRNCYAKSYFQNIPSSPYAIYHTAVAIGRDASADGRGVFSIGTGTSASGYYSYAFGRGISVNASNSFAFALDNLSSTTVTQNNTMAIMGGRVGIGTTSPTSTLDVRAPSESETPFKVYVPKGSFTYARFLVNSDGGVVIGNSTTDGPDRGLYVYGNVGLGTSSPSYRLQLSTNSAAKPTSNTWTISSDIRLKDVKGPYNKGLKEILLLDPFIYRYKKDNPLKIEETEIDSYGFSAQEVRKIFPEAVGENEMGYLDFDIHPILIAEINAFKELNNTIEEQKKIINDLKIKDEMREKELMLLKEEIEAIKAMLN
ncbi:MAG TPA: tail fiber domain-containing protein, partial [Tenuifilaceae bacterium]|nr:tail fiber domain-containing protein [Tenuifilaceae bacterium]